MNRDTTRRKLTMATAVVSLALAALLAACSGDGDVTVPTSGGGGSDTTQAPETTQAPDTTQAPATTQAPSGGSGSESSDDGDSNSAAIWALVIIGVIVIGLIVWLASRSGAKRGAQEQREAELAAQQQAEQAQQAAEEQRLQQEGSDTPDEDAGSSPPTV